MDKEYGKKIIAERVEEFEKSKIILTRKGHGETNIRSNYIDLMFNALGWNMKSHYEVVREYSQRDKSINGGTKKVDYAFKINGKLKFFIEAKEASVDLEKDKAAIFQAKRYAYSSNGKAPVVILTDFEEFRVFNVIKAPLMDNIDRELLKSHTMRYTEYIEKWDLLWDTFSREAVENGSLDRLRGKIDKNTKTMDIDFLEQITSWREVLAKNIALRNENLNVDEINEAVQRILDRLIFIRNLEDREIEPENTLLDKTKKSDNIYKSLIPIFNFLNKTYNGLLFKKHFSEDIIIDDKTIYDIIRQMNYPVSPFQFDVIEPEILGRIYEKFLGSKIRLTDSHRAKIEEKIEVRKAGGVYYTPEYIVEYIVQNTVGKKIEGLTPEEIKKIKIVDPACGSGSFLIGTYSYLLDYHQKWYTENQKDKNYQVDWYKTKDGEIKVSLDKRGDILRNNIFGVDIDKEATEVAIMSLYLKMLDDGFDKGERDLFFVKGSVLPDMLNNIKCGNSLIGTDYFEGTLDFDIQEMKEIKPFDWDKEFKEVFVTGGFDCVIGNPPYGAELSELERKYLENKYKLRNTDTACLFMSHGNNLLKIDGNNGFIVPKPFVYSSNWQSIREALLDGLAEIVDCGKVWKEVKLEQIIYFFNKGGNNKYYISSIRNEELIIYNGNIDKNTFKQFGFYLNGISEQELAIGEKILNSKKCLNDYISNQRGAMYQKQVVDKEDDFLVIGGKQINRYSFNDDLKGFVSKKIIQDEKAFIKENSILVQNIVAHIMNPTPHIKIIATLSESFDYKNCIILDTINQLNNSSELKIEFLLAILNSKLLSWYVYLFIFGKAIRTMHFDNFVTSRIPYPYIDLTNSKDKQIHDSLVYLVDQMLQTQKEYHNIKSDADKNLYEQTINLLDKKIDEIVYKLYDLSENEIQLIKEN